MKKRSFGFSFLSLLFSLLIIGILVVLYMNSGSLMSNGSAPKPKVAIDRAKVAACMANRKSIDASIAAWKMSHPGEKLDFDKYKKENGVPSCPSGGNYYLDENDSVVCSIHGK